MNNSLCMNYYRYSPLQFGLSVFEQGDGDSLIVRTFNCPPSSSPPYLALLFIYLFKNYILLLGYTMPSPTKSFKPQMTLDTSSAVFLVDNHFSFDRFFADGVAHWWIPSSSFAV